MKPNIESIIDEFILFAKECDTEVSKEVNGRPLNKDLRGYLIICNLIRISELLCSVIHLAEMRIPTGCFVILRTLSEAYLHLHGIVHDEFFSKEYIKKHLDEKRKRLSKIGPDLSKIRMGMTEEQRAELEREQDRLLEEHEGEMMASIFSTFKRFKKHEIYHLIYSHCSLWTHNDSHTFDRYLNDTDNGLEFVDYKDLNKDVVVSLLLALKLFFLSYEDVCKSITHEPLHRESFVRKYNELHDKFQKAFYKE